ncbi:MAG: hypothetical protein CMN30_18910 [Sandaracinus sp.]|nr:hypothetical protein [Sandaracinus sp.]
MSARATLVVPTLVLALVFARSAAAQPAFDVALEGCGELDREGLEAALELELFDVAPSLRELGAPEVRVACGEREVVVTIADPATDKTVSRRLPRPEPAAASRALALAVAELYLASWLELMTRPAEPEPEPEAPARDRLRERARARAAAALAPRPGASVGLAGFGRLRDLAAAYATVGGALRVALFPRRASLGWVLATTVEGGTATRERGDVRVLSGAVELGVVWRAWRRRAFELATELRAGLLYAHVDGRPSSASVRGASFGSAGGRATWALRPTLQGAHLRGTLVVELGVDLHAPVAAVAGEDSVQAGGLFLGAGLEMGFDIR